MVAPPREFESGIELPQLDRVPVVACENHAMPVRRPVRLRDVRQSAQAFCVSPRLASRIAIASSTSSFVISNGGMKRIVLCPHDISNSPF